jgi:outer membrane lipopolysaccharide assembly protein LptE/RlpB
MKNIKLIILILFLSNCGYSPIYNNQKIQNYKINVVEKNGDSEMNNLIENEIRLYSNKDALNIYELKMNTIYEKKVLTKDSSGVITDYNLSVTSIFKIDFKNTIKIVELRESINVKNQSDTYELNIYEKNIKRNFASSIREKLILKIQSINDN